MHVTAEVGNARVVTTVVLPATVFFLFSLVHAASSGNLCAMCLSLVFRSCGRESMFARVTLGTALAWLAEP